MTEQLRGIALETDVKKIGEFEFDREHCLTRELVSGD